MHIDIANGNVCWHPYRSIPSNGNIWGNTYATQYIKSQWRRAVFFEL